MKKAIETIKTTSITFGMFFPALITPKNITKPPGKYCPKSNVPSINPLKKTTINPYVLKKFVTVLISSSGEGRPIILHKAKKTK